MTAPRDSARRRRGRTAFVFAGGSALASIQVGMLRPLLHAGLRPDLVVGTSSGALNGALTAADPESAPARLERLWTTVRRRDVLPVRAPTVVRALAGRAPAFATAGGIRRVLERHLPVRRLEDTAVPFCVVAADLATREKVVLDRGDAVDALVATTAIPGIYPPVLIGGRLLADGGLAEDPPLGTAVERGATTIYLLPGGWPLGPAPEEGAVTRAMDALDWLFWRVAAAELARWAPECDLYVLPSPPITGLHPLSPKGARRLIAEAERMTREWLPRASTWRQTRLGAAG
jgi:NTE family protein